MIWFQIQVIINPIFQVRLNMGWESLAALVLSVKKQIRSGGRANFSVRWIVPLLVCGRLQLCSFAFKVCFSIKLSANSNGERTLENTLLYVLSSNS